MVDDEQWLDQASAQALGFVARRLAAEPVGLVFAARVPGEELAGLPELVVEGLAEGDARALLDSVLTGPLDARIRDRIVAETGAIRWRCWSCRGGWRRAAGGRVRAARREAAVGADRGEFPAADRCAPGPDPAAAAARGGGSVG